MGQASGVVEQSIAGALPNFRFGIPNVCTYCGEAAHEIDHCVPVCLTGVSHRALHCLQNKGITTWACRFCNARLSGKVFPGMLERFAYIRKIIESKAEKVKDNPDWTDQEILALDYTLQTYIASCQEKQKKLKRMLAWENSSGFCLLVDQLKQRPELDRKNPKYKPTLRHFFTGLAW